MTVPGILTVRTSSSRLPQKCLLPFGDCNVLEHCIRRALHFGLDPIVCTSTDPSDDVIETIAEAEGVPCFRGSLVNKLKRWADCAAQFDLGAFHTVDVDDPFFDADDMKRSFAHLMASRLDVVGPTPSSAAGSASVGYSLTRDIVARTVAELPDEADTEMIWYYVDKMPALRKETLPEPAAYTPFPARLTLDYPEDYWLLESVRRIVGNFASRQAVDDLFRRNPDLYKVNWFRNEQWKAGQDAKRV